MSDTEKENLDDQAAVDPPDGNGGTDASTQTSNSGAQAVAVDPPDGNGGTGG